MDDPVVVVERYIRPSKREIEIEYAMGGAWELSEFHGVRNQLLATMRKFGSVGPMGEFSLEGDCHYLEMGDPALGPTSRKPDYFVVDGQYSALRHQIVETERRHIRPGLLLSLVNLLRNTNGWMLRIAVEKSGLVISADRIGYEGDLFEGCETVADLELRCSLIQ
jgi:hypothetical protein